MHTWQVGAYKISEIHEFPVELGLLDGVVAQATPEVLLGVEWMHPDYITDAGETTWDIHSYVIDTGDTVILVDAGVGNGKSYPQQPAWTDLDSPFLERLKDAGYDRDDIDIVLLTHLHLDHVGWCAVKNDDGDWVPTFPHARLVLVRDEYERHLAQILSSDVDESNAESVDEDIDPVLRAFLPDPAALSEQTELIQQESLQPVVDAGLLDLVDANAEIAPGVHYESTPGHTSAHHSVRVQSEGESAFLTGDFFHHPIQVAHPDWSSQGDWSGEASATNRRAFLESAVSSGVLVLGTHFTGPGGGYVIEDGEGFRLVQSKP